MYKQSELSLILLDARCFLASERFWTSVSTSNGDSNDELSASYLQLQPFMRVSQKPLKSKFLSICHWQVFKMILRADTFSFRLYWTFPYFFNVAFLKPSIYAEWSLNLFTKCRAPLIESDEQSNTFTSIPMNVISKFTGEKIHWMSLSIWPCP